jgi:hypothetical protein
VQYYVFLTMYSLPCLGIGRERPLLGWVTESVADPGNSGGHDTGGVVNLSE